MLSQADCSVYTKPNISQLREIESLKALENEITNTHFNLTSYNFRTAESFISARPYEWMIRAVLLRLASKLPSNITFIPAGCQVWFLGGDLFFCLAPESSPESENGQYIWLSTCCLKDFYEELGEDLAWQLQTQQESCILLQCVLLRLEMKT